MPYGFARRSFNTFTPAGPDPRTRYHNYLTQGPLASQSSYGRGGRPQIPAYGSYGAQPQQVPNTSAQLGMIGVGGVGYASPTADALDALRAQAEEEEQGPIYNPNFRAPGRRLFARRGYHGPLYPNDQLNVHDGEQVRVHSPTAVTVIPKDMSQHPALQRQRRQFHFEDQYLSGARGVGDVGSDQYDQITAGTMAPYEATSPAARRAGYDLYASGQNPIRDLRRRMAQPDPARVAAAQAEIEAGRRPPQSQSGRPNLDQVARTMEEASQRGKNLGLDGPITIDQLLTTRALDRREAVQQFGTARPMAIGALHQQRRLESIEDKLAAAETERIRAEAIPSIAFGSTEAVGALPTRFWAFGATRPMCNEDHISCLAGSLS